MQLEVRGKIYWSLFYYNKIKTIIENPCSNQYDMKTHLMILKIHFQPKQSWSTQNSMRALQCCLTSALSMGLFGKYTHFFMGICIWFEDLWQRHRICFFLYLWVCFEFRDLQRFFLTFSYVESAIDSLRRIALRSQWLKLQFPFNWAVLHLKS